MNFGLLTKLGNDDKLCVSASKHELTAVVTPVRSDLLFTGNIAGCGLIQYLLAGNTTGRLMSAFEHPALSFLGKVKIYQKNTSGGHIMPANSILSFVDRLDQLTESLRAILHFLSDTREHSYLASLIQLICEQLEQLSASVLSTLRQEEATI